MWQTHFSTWLQAVRFIVLVPLFSMVVRAQAPSPFFHDPFHSRLQPGWSWIREDPKHWRITDEGLEVLIQPGNMWGPANDAKNILMRSAPDLKDGPLEITATISNHPTSQYEQVDLVWYYADSHMVKIGQEMVDGQMSIVMGREENDKTRTIKIIPLDSDDVQLRQIVSENKIEGWFKTPKADWRKAGETDLPVKGDPKITLQFYQGPKDQEHWARVSDFQIRRLPPAAAAPANKDWKLIWQDEFDHDGPPDPAKWSFEHGFVRNEELQYYQDQNAVCRDGLLIIEARREHRKNPDYRPGGFGWKNREWIDYTSASITTRRKFEFTYGKLEMRGRIDPRLGSWPAFWTLGTANRMRWPRCGEVDVMEYYTNTLLANVCHTLSNAQKWTITRTPLDKLGPPGWPDQFHVWTMLWDAKSIDLLVDGKTLTHFDVADDDEPGKQNAFRNPHYLLLNQALGGVRGGDPSRTDFPIRFEVDYVRCYQRAAGD